MTISLRKLALSLVFVFTAMLFALFVLFDTYAWGKYVLFGLSLAVLLLGGFLGKGKILFRVDAYVALNILFIVYILLTSLWAMRPSDTLTMATTMFRILICAYILYCTYTSIPELDETVLLKAVMWAGYVVAIYSIAFYGVDQMIAAGRDDSLRVDNEFSNVNSIGLISVLSCMIQVNLPLLDRKTRLFPSALFLIPCVIVIAATQSRKALVFLIAGVLIGAVVWAQKSKTKRGSVVKAVFGLGIGVLLVYLLLRTEMFSGIRERMQGLINALLGTGKVDHSTVLRNNLRNLGWEEFLKHPIGGIGIANPHILAAQRYSFDAYLHDNFAELLCGGGIFGFVTYYSLYAYLFFQLWKHRGADRQRATFFALWLLLMLAMDYGMVSYYSKSQNFYLMIHFVNVFFLKRKAVSHEL